MTAQIDSSPCHSPIWLRGSHLQTVYGAVVARYHRIAFVRERVNTPDGDFLDFDWTGPGLFSDRLASGASTAPDPSLLKTAARRWMDDSDWTALATTPETPALVLFHGLDAGPEPRADPAACRIRLRGGVSVIALVGLPFFVAGRGAQPAVHRDGGRVAR